MNKEQIIKSMENLAKSNERYAKIVRDYRNDDEGAIELIDYLETRNLANEIDLIMEMCF